MNRKQRQSAAEETLSILERGVYTTPFGGNVSIAESVDACIAATRVIAPDEWTGIYGDLKPPDWGNLVPPIVEISGETTLAAARRMHEEDSAADLLALNFASAKNPGGGFLSGSQAQEESLARSSALYKSLLKGEAYYQFNRAMESKLYSDYAIHSPNVPVFRSDEGALLETPYTLTIHTAPAPNFGAMEPSSPDRELVPTKICHRITHLCAMATLTGHRRLVLGAWGCGVFRNDPAMVATMFVSTLFAHHWSRRFRHICFAVRDSSPEQTTRQAFERILAPYVTRKSK